MSQLGQEASHATKSALYLMVGYGVSTILSTVFAILVPAILGAAHYGDWVIFRSLISLTLTTSVMGTSHVIGRYYVGLVAQGESDEAARLYKTMFVIRVASSMIFAVVGALLLIALRHELMGWSAAGWLVMSILLHAVSTMFMTLMHGQKRMGLVALFMLPSTIAIPAAVAVGYLVGGFDLVPLSCVAGEVVLLVIALVVAWPHVSWPRGWMDRSYLREIFRFGGFSAAGGIIIGLYGVLAPYLMSMLGISSEEIGFTGLGLRFHYLIWWGLMSVAGGMTPFITVAFEKEGIDRAAVWIGLLGRLGAVACLYAIGVFLLMGNVFVNLVWGSTYGHAVDTITLLIAATLPVWIGSQYTSVAMLYKRADLFTLAVACMNVASFGLFFLLVPTMQSFGAALVQVCGTCVYMCMAYEITKRVLNVRLQLSSLWVPVVVTAAAYPVGRVVESVAILGIALVGWSVVFLIASVRSGSFHFYELREIITRLIESKKTPPDTVEAV